MPNDQPSPGSALVRYLREKGFTVEADDRPGSYRVTAHRDFPMPFRPRLNLPDDLLTEYLKELDRTPDATGGLDTLSLIEAHLEEALATTVDDENDTTAVGVRRTAQGAVEWFWHREAASGSPNYGIPPADLEWRAD